jgi:hypothetical protein
MPWREQNVLAKELKQWFAIERDMFSPSSSLSPHMYEML